MCALRADSHGAWGVIDDSGHTPSGVAKVETLSDRVRVHHEAGLRRVLGASCDTDETYARNGIRAGASVGLEYTDVYLVNDSGSPPRAWREPRTLYLSNANVWLTVWGE